MKPDREEMTTSKSRPGTKKRIFIEETDKQKEKKTDTFTRGRLSD